MTRERRTRGAADDEPGLEHVLECTGGEALGVGEDLEHRDGSEAGLLGGVAATVVSRMR